jgi:hypothetical protein
MVRAPVGRCRNVLNMDVFIFRSDMDWRQFAFTRDKAGADLPEELGPWHQSGGRAMPSIVGLPASVLAAIRAKGYVMLQIERPPPRSQARQTPRRLAMVME